MLTKSDFEKAAEKIASKFVACDGDETINQLSKKVAAENNLNPDQIRTMVRLANVSIFGKLFQDKTGSDRDVKFDVGDAEQVIDGLYDDTKDIVVSREKVATYNRNLDYFGDLYPIEQVKVAEHTDKKEPVARPKYTKPELVMQFKRASDRFRLDALQEKARWQMNLETAASIYKKAHGLKLAEDFPTFENDMIASDVGVLPEIQAIRHMVLKEKVASYNDNDVATILDRHVANPSVDDATILGHLKDASVSRTAYLKLQECQNVIAKNLEGLK